MRKVKKGASYTYLGLIFLFLYAPILVLIVLSFNNSMSRTVWGGFTFKWYFNLPSNDTIMDALWTTLRITLSSSILATILGTTAALGINRMKKHHAAIMLGATNIPLLNADIVTGISLMLLFTRFTSLGEFSVVLAHIAFSVPYVIFNVLPKLQSMSDACIEAAMDLGASPAYAFYKVILPEIFPGVLSGFLMAFTMSLDDFTITYFTKGAGVNTLSTMLYTELRKGIQPELYALSTLLFLLAFVMLIATNLKGIRKKEVVR
ncbi:MAG: ABC transporter permease [Pseudobutyrivibrio sp.]|uniref:ABC transporter permease n=1 Tax=Pseudobutyrivibrio sp. TaxID=2014367 RepID=UPI001B16008B|nr:ABC transporter permease [Pseudobutyrivibrio sp.]MBO5617994.1 ABC transporter permease [Pseudobutyrivibrio sp.]MBO6282994.1 ABC transporter permease [Pseudobutyrivibrio sp.]MBP3261666.1 ABC transporter permease [Pseudobutyrivibrio sp.]